MKKSNIRCVLLSLLIFTVANCSQEVEPGLEIDRQLAIGNRAVEIPTAVDTVHIHAYDSECFAAQLCEDLNAVAEIENLPGKLENFGIK